MVKKVLAAGLAVLALGAPAVAAADPAIGGFLSVKAAIRFQKKYFPPVAPTSLLRDNRATFSKTKRPISVKSCRRVNSATVICRFSLIMTPNAAHRRAHWFQSVAAERSAVAIALTTRSSVTCAATSARRFLPPAPWESPERGGRRPA